MDLTYYCYPKKAQPPTWKSILRQKKKIHFHGFNLIYESFSIDDYWIQSLLKENIMKIFSKKFPDASPLIIPKIDLSNKEKFFNLIKIATTFY
jgi:hypothetical protein